MVHEGVKLKRRDFKHLVKGRKLTEQEAMEEAIYRRQLIHSWGFRRGHTPQDEHKKQQVEE